MLIFICFIVLAQAYAFSWIIPSYQMIVANAPQVIPDFTVGYVYLMVLVAVLVAFVATIKLINKKKVIPDISQ
jgi:lactate permease